MSCPSRAISAAATVPGAPSMLAMTICEILWRTPGDGKREGVESTGAALGGDRGGAQREADTAEAHEIGAALKIEGPRRCWRRGWGDDGAQRHPITRCQFWLPAGETHAHTLWRQRRRETGNARALQRHPGARGLGFHGSAAAAEADRPQAFRQHGRGHRLGAPLDDREASRHCPQCRHDQDQRRPTAGPPLPGPGRRRGSMPRATAAAQPAMRNRRRCRSRRTPAARGSNALLRR